MLMCIPNNEQFDMHIKPDGVKKTSHKRMDETAVLNSPKVFEQLTLRYNVVIVTQRTLCKFILKFN